MKIFRENFRIWWQVPRRAGEKIEHRQVTFLELFYDLVYVALIAQFTHQLSSNFTWLGVAEFAFLFIIVWWAWYNGTLYHDLHGNNDIRTRVFTFLQMFTVIAMTIFAHDAIGHSSVGFALSYAAFQLLLTILWWRTGVHDDDHRPLSVPYSLLFVFNTLLFVASVFVPEPLRYYLWGFATIIAILMPLLTFFVGKNNPTIQNQISLLIDVNPSLVERFGLFTIIVLGEVIVGILSGVLSHHHLTVELGTLTFFSVLIAIGLWWLYFDYISHKIPKRNVFQFTVWYYLHLPVVMAIVIIGAALSNIIETFGHTFPDEIKIISVISIALILFGISLLGLTVKHPKDHLDFVKRGNIVSMIIALIILGFGFIEINPLIFIVIVAFLILIPVIVAIFTWVNYMKKIK
jgi:low temperature requirement protein LtrA